MAREFDVTFRVAGEKTVSHYADTADGARKDVAGWTWGDVLDNEYIDAIAEDLDEWCKIEIVDIVDKGELPPPRPSLYSAPIVEALQRILSNYSLEAFRTYDGSLDHPYRDMCAVAKAFDGNVVGPLPDELDVVRGYKTGEVAASEHSNMPLGELVEKMLGIRTRLANVMDDDEASRPLRREYNRLLRELRFRDPNAAAAEWMRQVGGGERDERGS